MKKIFLLVLFIICAFCIAANLSSIDLDRKTFYDFRDEITKMESGEKDLKARCMDSFGWTIIHAPSHLLQEKFIPAVEDFFAVMKKSQTEQDEFIKQGGVTKFRSLLRELLKSNDPGCEAFSALLLASINDKSSAPEIAKLLEIDRSSPPPKEYSNLTNIHRAAAAVALAMMNEAAPYEKQIINLLDSINTNDVSGATKSIMLMNWEQYLPRIAPWLDFPDVPDDKENPHQLNEVRFQAAMELIVFFQAKEYASKLANGIATISYADKQTGKTQYMKKYMTIRPESVIYSLISLDAKDSVAAMADFFPKTGKYDSFSRNAILTAFMVFNAKEYIDIVRKELANNDISTKERCLIALALLGNDDDIKTIATYLDDPQKVDSASAALMFLERQEYYPKIREKLTAYLDKEFPNLDKKDLTFFWRVRFCDGNCQSQQIDNAAIKVERVWRSILH